MEKLMEKILIAMGAASMCWEDLGKAGVFQSERAETIGIELKQWILENYEKK